MRERKRKKRERGHLAGGREIRGFGNTWPAKPQVIPRKGQRVTTGETIKPGEIMFISSPLILGHTLTSM
jgi:hypothetical protein